MRKHVSVNPQILELHKPSAILKEKRCRPLSYLFIIIFCWLTPVQYWSNLHRPCAKSHYIFSAGMWYVQKILIFTSQYSYFVFHTPKCLKMSSSSLQHPVLGTWQQRGCVLSSARASLSCQETGFLDSCLLTLRTSCHLFTEPKWNSLWEKILQVLLHGWN